MRVGMEANGSMGNKPLKENSVFSNSRRKEVKRKVHHTIFRTGEGCFFPPWRLNFHLFFQRGENESCIRSQHDAMNMRMVNWLLSFMMLTSNNRLRLALDLFNCGNRQVCWNVICVLQVGLQTNTTLDTIASRAVRCTWVQTHWTVLNTFVFGGCVPRPLLCFLPFSRLESTFFKFVMELQWSSWIIIWPFHHQGGSREMAKEMGWNFLPPTQCWIRIRMRVVGLPNQMLLCGLWLWRCFHSHIGWVFVTDYPPPSNG